MELNKRLTDSLVQMAKREQPDQFNSWTATGTGDGTTSLEPEEALFPEFAPSSSMSRPRPHPRMMNSAPLAPTHLPHVSVKPSASVGLTSVMPSNPPQPTASGPNPTVITTTPPAPGPPQSAGGPPSYNDFLTHVPPPTPGTLNTAIARPRGVTTSPVPTGVSRTSLPPTRPPASISVTPPPTRQSQPVGAGRGNAPLGLAKANVRKRPSGATNAFTIAQRGRTPQGQGRYDDYAS